MEVETMEKIIVVEYTDILIDDNDKFKQMAMTNNVNDIFRYNVRQCNMRNYGTPDVVVRALKDVDDLQETCMA